MSEESVTNEIACTCNDEYVSSMCPVHHSEKVKKASQSFAPNVTVLTDDDLASPHVQTWYGHGFNCRNEKCQRMILHFMSFCPSCGEQIQVQSRRVTDQIRILEARNNERINELGKG